MRRAQGYRLIVDPDRPVVEADTITCGHCQRVTVVKPFEDAASSAGLCRLCDRIICPRCTALKRCLPWEETMNRMEARERLYRDLPRPTLPPVSEDEWHRRVRGR